MEAQGSRLVLGVANGVKTRMCVRHGASGLDNSGSKAKAARLRMTTMHMQAQRSDSECAVAATVITTPKTKAIASLSYAIKHCRRHRPWPSTLLRPIHEPASES